MLHRTKRPLLAFESDEQEETLTPNAKRFAGLTTPPASPEKKLDVNRPMDQGTTLRPFGVVSPNLPNLQETHAADAAYKPKRLTFGSDPVISRTKSLLQQSSVVNCEHTWLATRKSEHDEIMDFVVGSVATGTQTNENSLYITGPPGTGKTAQLDLILREKFLQIVPDHNSCDLPAHESDLTNASYLEIGHGIYKSVCVAKVNCIALEKPEQIFQKLVSDIYTGRTDTASDESRTSVKHISAFCKSRPRTHFILILDEMDKLIKNGTGGTTKTKIILDLFLLAKEPGINVTIIGIANSIDLKDRFLNRLNLQKELLPRVIHFHPYNSEQMFDIVKSRLAAFPACFELFQPMAIRFATTKCSGSTGDLRRLFDLLRGSVQLLEMESFKGSKDSSATKRVTISHVAKAVSKFMNSATTKTRISPLNIQHKIVLCSLVHRERFDLYRGMCTIDESYDYYVKLLKATEVMKPLNKSEYLESCNSLQTCGLVVIEFTKKKTLSSGIQKIIKSSLIEAELQEEIGKIELLKRLL